MPARNIQTLTDGKLCFAAKTPLGHSRAELCKMLCGEPLDRIALGHVGPFPRTANRNEYLHVVADYFTKFADAYAVPDVRAFTTADVLVAQFISRYRVPFIIHWNQGFAFESEISGNTADLFET